MARGGRTDEGFFITGLILVLAVLALWPVLPAEARILTSGCAGPPVDVPGDFPGPPFMWVGNNCPDGTLTVDGGSTLTLAPAANILVGGNQYPSTSTGSGTVLIDGGKVKFGDPKGGIAVGRWGTGSYGSLSIKNGGALDTYYLLTGVGDGAGGNGSHGTVLIDGAGTTVTFSGVNSTGSASGGTVGGDGGSGTWTVSNGATVAVGGADATALTGNGFTLGNRGGTGEMTVTGSGTSFTINATPIGGGFSLGATAGSQGTLNVSGGASLTINATTGGGGFSGGGGFTIGSTGTGIMTVSGSGTTVVQDGQTTSATPGITIGAQAGSDGTLTVQDGAALTINRSSAGCCITVGRLGHGSLNITGGGTLTINDSSGTVGPGIAFGGNSTSGPGGTFDALISGPGSTLSIYGIDAGFSLGRARLASGTMTSGTMTVDSGATINTDVFSVGPVAESTAAMVVAGGGTTINLVADPEGITGTGFAVGAGGMGTMTVDDGAVITIDGTAAPDLPGGFTVGGSRTAEAGGTGKLSLDGAGTLIQILGAVQEGFNVGFDNTCLNLGPCNLPSTGRLRVSNRAQILTASDNRSSIGSTGKTHDPVTLLCTEACSAGSATVTGAGSLIDAGAFLGIGKDRDGNPGGTGILTVEMGGTVKATVINCGAGGTINGDGGILIGEVIADPACVISPGGSPGTLSIIGSLTTLGAKVILEVDAFGNHDVLAVEGTAAFDAATQVEVRVDPAFRPSGGTALQMVQVQLTPQDPVQPLLTLNVAESGGGTVETQGDLSTLTQPPIVVPDISIPPTIRAVQIDIKPGAFPNVIKLGSAGAIPVAILSTPAFDALTVDPLTITLDGAKVKLVGKGQRPLCSAKDVNGDGRKDLVCRIVTSQLPEEGDGVAILDAMTFPTASSPGIPIRGADFIRIVPDQEEEEESEDPDPRGGPHPDRKEVRERAGGGTAGSTP